MSDHRNLDEILDDGVEALRDLELEASVADRAAARARQRLAQQIPGFSAEGLASGPQDPGKSILRDCEDYQALIPAYLAGNLSPSRRLLLEDHSRSCLSCRRAVKQARSGEPAASRPQPLAAVPSRRGPVLRWAAAAILAVALGFTAWNLLDVLDLTHRQTATIAALHGDLYRVAPEGYIPLAVGQEIPFGKTMRTAKGSGAVVRLTDGSEVEISARAEVQLVERRQGTTIELARGNIIVEAAPQDSGRLFVATDDCLVSVKGTIFSVNSGTKGSRISVLEGQVAVDYGAREAVLEPGDQVSTHPSLGPVPVSREIAWSRNFDEYLALMRELEALGEEIDETLAQPELRYSTELLDLMPTGTVFYAAVPNLSSNLHQAYQTIQERIATSPALDAWWQETVVSEADQETLELAITEVTRLGSFLGDELVLSLSAQDGSSEIDEGVVESLLLVSSATDPAGLVAYVEEHRWEAESLPIHLVEDPDRGLPAAGDEALFLWVGDEVAALARDVETLRGLKGTLQRPQDNPFLSTRFRQRLAEAYGDGADWLVGADMGRILEGSEGTRGEVLERAGVLDVETLILERKKGTGAPVHYGAVLSFDGPRRGIASWLEAPAPMGSLEFVSPDANFVSAGLTKEPGLAVDEILDLLELAAPDLRSRIESLEAEHGLSLVEDFAAPLGGELTFALDGPILPTPSWKLIAEVYDPAHLQDTVGRLVDLVNSHSSRPEGLLRLEEVRSGGSTYHALRSNQANLSIYYTFLDGYLLAGPSIALLEHAAQYRASGYTLVDSAKFTALLPSDGQANFSGLTFQNLESVLNPLADLWGQREADLSPDQRQSLRELMAQSPATLTCFYGENDRIVAVSNSERGELASLLGVSSGLGIDRWMKSLGEGFLKLDLADETPAAQAE